MTEELFAIVNCKQLLAELAHTHRKEIGEIIINYVKEAKKQNSIESIFDQKLLVAIDS